jgi:hypothetical protein
MDTLMMCMLLFGSIRTFSKKLHVHVVELSHFSSMFWINCIYLHQLITFTIMDIRFRAIRPFLFLDRCFTDRITEIMESIKKLDGTVYTRDSTILYVLNLKACNITKNYGKTVLTLEWLQCVNVINTELRLCTFNILNRVTGQKGGTPAS